MTDKADAAVLWRGGRRRMAVSEVLITAGYTRTTQSGAAAQPACCDCVIIILCHRYKILLLLVLARHDFQTITLYNIQYNIQYSIYDIMTI